MLKRLLKSYLSKVFENLLCRSKKRQEKQRVSMIVTQPGIQFARGMTVLSYYACCFMVLFAALAVFVLVVSAVVMNIARDQRNKKMNGELTRRRSIKAPSRSKSPRSEPTWAGSESTGSEPAWTHWRS